MITTPSNSLPFDLWQDPGFDNPPHVHDEAEAFYVLEGTCTFYTDTDPAEGVGPGTFVFIPPGAIHGFRTGPEGGRLLCLWPSTVEAAFFGVAPPNATEVQHGWSKLVLSDKEGQPRARGGRPTNAAGPHPAKGMGASGARACYQPQ